MPGGIPGWVANLVHVSNFQSAEATSVGAVPAISLLAHGLYHPRGAEILPDRQRRIGCCDRNVGSGRELLRSEIALCELAPSKSAVSSTRLSDAGDVSIAVRRHFVVRTQLAS